MLILMCELELASCSLFPSLPLKIILDTKAFGDVFWLYLKIQTGRRKPLVKRIEFRSMFWPCFEI